VFVSDSLRAGAQPSSETCDPPLASSATAMLSTPASPSTSSDEGSFASTAATTRSPSPKLDSLGGAGLPSPFFPPTLAQGQLVASAHSPDPLPSQ